MGFFLNNRQEDPNRTQPLHQKCKSTPRGVYMTARNSAQLSGAWSGLGTVHLPMVQEWVYPGGVHLPYTRVGIPLRTNLD